ncbi:MAG TPA: hypothetical protein VK679_02815 [Gemmatimonadaceae bacterium]|nr:hypothetical protein [Gemmatimonadaceae bacterium]
MAVSLALSMSGRAQVAAASRDSVSVSGAMQRDMHALAGSPDSLACEVPQGPSASAERVCVKPGRNSVLAMMLPDQRFEFVTRSLELKHDTESPATDSTLAALEGVYGAPTMCARDSFRFPAYPQHYIWHRGDFTIQLVSTAPSSPRHPILSVQIAHGLLTCSNWARPPMRNTVIHVDIDSMNAAKRQLETWAARAGQSRAEAGDTTWEALNATDHRRLSATLRVSVPAGLLSSREDSAARALDKRYGAGIDCFADPYRPVPPRLYRQWDLGDVTIRLQRDTVHASIAEQIINGSMPCGGGGARREMGLEAGVHRHHNCRYDSRPRHSLDASPGGRRISTREPRN